MLSPVGFLGRSSLLSVVTISSDCRLQLKRCRGGLGRLTLVLSLIIFLFRLTKNKVVEVILAVVLSSRQSKLVLE